MALLKNGNIEFSNHVEVPGENWSIGVPNGFMFSTDPAVNGESKTNPSGVYDLIIAKKKFDEKTVDFGQPYDNAVAFVSLEKLSSIDINRYITVPGLEWEVVISSESLVVSFAEFISNKNIVSYQILIATGSTGRRCQILLNTNDKKEEKREFVRLMLCSISLTAEAQTVSDRAASGYKFLSHVIKVDENRKNHFLVNGEWTFEIPDGFIYEIDSEIGEGGALSGGIDLSGLKKPMVIRGLHNGSAYVFNFGLQKHFDIKGQYFTVDDCKNDNRAAEGSVFYQQVIVVDEDNLFVDIIFENIWPLVYSLKIRIRSANITPFDFLSMPGNLSNDVMNGVVKSMIDIAASVCLKDVPASKEARIKKFKENSKHSENSSKRTSNNMDSEYGPESEQPSLVGRNPQKLQHGGYLMEGDCFKQYFGKYAEVNTGLTEIILPDCTRVGEDAFQYNDTLSVIVVPEGVVSIGNYAFYGCEKLELVILPDSLEEIGESAFWESTIKHIVIPEKVQTIKGSCFQDCAQLKTVVLPRSLRSISDEYAFSGCNDLESIVIPNGVEYIGKSSFYDCQKLQSVQLPDTLREIGDYAFYSCDNLKELYVPSSVCRIGEHALGYSGDITIHTPAGSFAEKYCCENDIDVDNNV